MRRAADPQDPFQVIIVTHLPHLYRERLTRDECEPFNFIYLCRGGEVIEACKEEGSHTHCHYGMDGANLAARSAQEDVMQLAKGLRLYEEISIMPRWLRVAINFFKEKFIGPRLKKMRDTWSRYRGKRGERDLEREKNG
jgi:hypothetical protein